MSRWFSGVFVAFLWLFDKKFVFVEKNWCQDVDKVEKRCYNLVTNLEEGFHGWK